MFNAMTYPDVRCFGIVLHRKLHELLKGEPPKTDRLNKIDDEDLSYLIEELIDKINKVRDR